MKLLILTQYYIPESGSPPVRLHAIAKELLKLGHKVEVVTAMPNHPTGKIFPDYQRKLYICEKRDGIFEHRVWLYPSTGAGLRRMANYSSFLFSSLIGMARAKKPDFIFVNSPPPFLSLSALIYSKLWDVPFIFHVGDLWPDVPHKLGLVKGGISLRMTEWLERWTYRKAAYINAVTKPDWETLVKEKHVNPRKLLFLPNGVDIEMFKPRPYNSNLKQRLCIEKERIVLYAGNHGFAHGLETVLEAARLLVQEKIRFLFVGDGSKKANLVNKAKTLGLSNVTFMDPVPVEQVAQLYNQSDAGLAVFRDAAALENTISAKIFPCMASGKPVVYSGSGETGRLIRATDTGVVVPPENPLALAEIISKVIHDPKWATRMGRNGRRYVENHLSWPIIVRNWLTQLEASERMGLRKFNKKLDTATEY